MKKIEKLKVLKEITKVVNEATKYYLGEGVHTFFRDFEDPKMYWIGSGEKKKKVSESEVDKYAKYNEVIKWNWNIVETEAQKTERGGNLKT